MSRALGLLYLSFPLVVLPLPSVILSPTIDKYLELLGTHPSMPLIRYLMTLAWWRPNSRVLFNTPMCSLSQTWSCELQVFHLIAKGEPGVSPTSRMTSNSTTSNTGLEIHRNREHLSFRDWEIKGIRNNQGSFWNSSRSLAAIESNSLQAIPLDVSSTGRSIEWQGDSYAVNGYRDEAKSVGEAKPDLWCTKGYLDCLTKSRVCEDCS